MPYIVLARKWRPKSFDELIGQSHITTTLKNSISYERVAHAYLFAGPRGIGKTSCARIFAKALNCEHGPTPTPCNKCSNCIETNELRNLDVIEIDGASNRGIDEVRQLRENVKFSPSKSRFKIYIIDEVHMLTEAAFNALLKTLEEPPLHVKFIFATTQPYKVIPTIISRCQRFDFKRISVSGIASKLNLICKAEGIKIKDEAIFAIAKAAEGSMRDAESILDQLASFSQDELTVENINSLLGLVGQNILFEAADIILKKDPRQALKLIDRLVNEGKDIAQFLIELIGHFRNLLIAKVGKDLKDLIDLSAQTIDEISNQSKNFSIEELLYILNILTRTQFAVGRSDIKRIPIEISMVRLAKRDSLVSLEKLLEEVKDLEKRIYAVPEPDNAMPTEEENPKGQPPQEPETESDEQIPLDKIKEIWKIALDEIKKEKMSAATFLKEGFPVAIEGRKILIGFSKNLSFYKEVLGANSNKKLIEDILGQILKKKILIEFITSQKIDAGGDDLEENAETTLNNTQVELNNSAEEIADNPIIQSAIDIFDGRIIKKKKE